MPSVPESHKDILDTNSFAHVATVGPNGQPHTSPVWFEWDGEGLLFSTTKPRQKFRNVQRDPRAAVSILDPNDPYRHLEIRGTIEVEEDPDASLIHKLAKRYQGKDRFEGNVQERVILKLIPEKFNTYG